MAKEVVYTDPRIDLALAHLSQGFRDKFSELQPIFEALASPKSPLNEKILFIKDELSEKKPELLFLATERIVDADDIEELLQGSLNEEINIVEILNFLEQEEIDAAVEEGLLDRLKARAASAKGKAASAASKLGAKAAGKLGAPEAAAELERAAAARKGAAQDKEVVVLRKSLGKRIKKVQARFQKELQAND